VDSPYGTYNGVATTVLGQLHHYLRICAQDCNDLLSCVCGLIKKPIINYGPIQSALYTQNVIIITQSEGMKTVPIYIYIPT
jgi:hypothetical protein